MKSAPPPLLQAIVGFATLTLVLLSALALGANRPVSWSLLSLAVTALFVVQVLLTLPMSPAPVQLRRAVLPGVLYLAVLIWGVVQVFPGISTGLAHPVWSLVPEAQATISADPGQGRHALMRLACYGMIFVITLWTALRPGGAGAVLQVIAVFSGLLAAYGLYCFAAGENPILGEAYTNKRIVQASFVNRNSYATYAGFGALANIAAYLHVSKSDEGPLRRRLESFFRLGWIYALGALLCIGALSLTQSRAGGGSAVFGLVVFLGAWARQREGKGYVLPGVIALVLLFVGATSATGMLERMIGTDANDGRFAVYPAIFQAIGDRPMLGHGLGAFQEAFRPYIPLEGAMGEWVRAHSTHLELAFGLGLPAVAIFYLAQGIIVLRIWRGSRLRRQDRAFSCFALGCVAIATLHSAFDFSLQMPATAALFAAILGLGFAQSFTKAETDVARHRTGKSRNIDPAALHSA